MPYAILWTFAGLNRHFEFHKHRQLSSVRVTAVEQTETSAEFSATSAILPRLQDKCHLT